MKSLPIRVVVLLLLAVHGVAGAQIVIHEIMYHPQHGPLEPEPGGQEFLELANIGSEAVDISGWEITEGVRFEFPSGTRINPGQYLVVVADHAAFQQRYPGVSPVAGGWHGHLGNRGELIVLKDAEETVVDRVEYSDEGDWGVRELGPDDYGHRGWQWSDVHDGRGHSLELVQPGLPNEAGQNWAPSTEIGGTPGMANSVSAADGAPLILDVQHSPAVPGPNDPVAVTARVVDENQTTISVRLRYRVDRSVYGQQDVYPQFEPDDFNDVAMYDDGAHGDGAAGDGVFGTMLPAHADQTIVEFFVAACDFAGHWRMWPAPAVVDGIDQQVVNALYQVDAAFDADLVWEAGAQPLYHMVMTNGEKGRILDIGDGGSEANSQAQMNATFISADGVDIKVRYNVGVRNRGHGSRNDPPNNYRVNFSHDRPWKSAVAINLNTKYTYLQLMGSLLFKMAGLPQPDATAVQVRVNGENLAVSNDEMYGSYVHIEAVDSDYATRHFPDNDGGNLYKCMRITHQADLRYEGSDPGQYLPNYEKQSNSAINDWSDLIGLTYTLSSETPDADYVDAVSRVIDVDQWLRFLAINAILDNSETTLANGNGDDYFLYFRSGDHRAILVQHDLDSILGMGDSRGSATEEIFRATTIEAMERFLTHPTFVARYYWHLTNLLEGVFSDEPFDALLTEHIGSFVPQAKIVEMKDFVRRRRDHILSLIPSTFTAQANLPIVSGYHFAATPAAPLYGTAKAIPTRSILVNGQQALWSPLDGQWSLGQGGGGNTTESLIEPGAIWKYLDDGSNQGSAADGPAWFGHPDYDDTLWAEGPAELGYGNTPVTQVNSGPGGSHYITTYFRHHFVVEDPTRYDSMILRIVRDDGAAVYLNGNRIVLTNLSDPYDYLTEADDVVGGSEESTFFEYAVETDHLVAGVNVMAVEVHQSSATSSDVSFNLELVGDVFGETLPATGVALRPGINHIMVQSFDGTAGAGTELDRAYVDVWYDDGHMSTLSGTVAGETVLDVESGPWHITTDLIVPSGATLTIEPGATLFFDPGCGVTVQAGGRLVAEGTFTDHIRLTRTPGGTSNWDGILFDRTLEDNRLVFVDHEFGDGQGESVDVQDARVTIDGVTWSGTNTRVLNIDHPSVVCRNSVFPSISGTEPLHGVGLSGQEYIIFENCTFGTASGYNDIIDFSGGKRPGPIIQMYDNFFLGGGDDALDFDGTDGHVEGNIFMAFANGRDGNTNNSTSNAVATDAGSDIVLARNLFIGGDHHVLLKNDVSITAQNNTFVGVTMASINFGEPGRGVGPGAGAYLEGNIFHNNATLFFNIFDNPQYPGYGPDPMPVANNTILPAEWLDLGTDNIDADPLFVDVQNDFRLLQDSAAVSAGSWELDAGALVPAGAAIAGVPDGITYRRTATLTVGGPGITHYMYSVNDPTGPWSQERPIDIPIELTGLSNGQSYSVYLLGKNSAGRWQESPRASRTWLVDTSYSRLVLNEVLARSHGNEPDMIELYYDGPTPLDLTGFSLSDDPMQPRKFVFSSSTVTSTTFDPGEYCILYGDLQTQVKDHIGLALAVEGEALYLYSPGGQLIDSIEFGMQIDDYSVGRVGVGAQWKLCTPTFGGPNVRAALGDRRMLKINEWLADGTSPSSEDFIELYNPHSSPVSLGGMYLTDNPIAQPAKSQFLPLSFIPAGGFVTVLANNSAKPGSVSFRLSPDGEMIALLDNDLHEIDKILYRPQSTDISQGRWPDGADTLAFFAVPTPGQAN